jgi:hypothetical protein
LILFFFQLLVFYLYRYQPFNYSTSFDSTVHRFRYPILGAKKLPLAPIATLSLPTSTMGAAATTASYPTPMVANVLDANPSLETPVEASLAGNVANLHRALEVRLLQAQQQRNIVAELEQWQQAHARLVLEIGMVALNC